MEGASEVRSQHSDSMMMTTMFVVFVRVLWVNEKLFKLADKNSIFMHCLPAHSGEEVSEGVLRGKRSVIFDQAENRLHVQKAIVSYLVQKNRELK